MTIVLPAGIGARRVACLALITAAATAGCGTAGQPDQHHDGARVRVNAPPARPVHAAASARFPTPPPLALPDRCRLKLSLPALQMPGRPQQIPLSFQILDDSSADCQVGGYPRITLRTTAGRILAFRYRDGGGQTVTSHRPPQLRLRPGHSAYFLISQNACTARSTAVARRITVALPGQRGVLRAALPDYPQVGYCGPGEGRIFISPVERALDATVNHRQ